MQPPHGSGPIPLPDEDAVVAPDTVEAVPLVEPDAVVVPLVIVPDAVVLDPPVPEVSSPHPAANDAVASPIDPHAKAQSDIRFIVFLLAEAKESGASSRQPVR